MWLEKTFPSTKMSSPWMDSLSSTRWRRKRAKVVQLGRHQISYKPIFDFLGCTIGDPAELWITLNAMGYNFGLQQDEASAFQVTTVLRSFLRFFEVQVTARGGFLLW